MDYVFFIVPHNIEINSYTMSLFLLRMAKKESWIRKYVFILCSCVPLALPVTPKAECQLRSYRNQHKRSLRLMLLLYRSGIVWCPLESRCRPSADRAQGRLP